MSKEVSEIGSRIRARRRFLDVSQKELAAALGLSFQQISKYEQGHSAPSAVVFARIAQFLEISSEELLPASLRFSARPPRDDQVAA